LRRLLSVPWIYTALQNAAGARRVRATLAREFIRPRPGERVLDVGCGPAEMLPELSGVHYVGIDLSAAYIDAARARYPGRGEFLVGDAASLGTTGRRFDVVLGIALLHHLDDAEAESFLAAAADLLEPGGRFLSFDCAYTTPQNPVARFLISRDRGRHVRTPAAYEALLRRHFELVRTDLRTDLNWIPYTHFVMTGTRPRSRAAEPAE
jgi:SAM-dependent methyltransferase